MCFYRIFEESSNLKNVDDFLHYGAKLCILCIISGFRNKLKSDLSRRNPQHCCFSLNFFAVLVSINKYQKHCTGQNCSKCADKIYVTAICTRNSSKFCMWNPLAFWNIIKDLLRESRNVQIQNCALIQCTIWPRNVLNITLILNII